MVRANPEYFGSGRLTGSSQGEMEIFYQDLVNSRWDTMTDYLGEAEACQDVSRIKQKKGAEQAAKDYAELLFLRRYMEIYMEKVNPLWSKELTSSHARSSNEPPGDYDESWVPEDHHEIVRAPAQLNAYNLPRLMREFLGPRDDRTADRIAKGFHIYFDTLQESYKKGHSLTEMVVNLAEHFAQVDQDPRKYVRRLLNVGKLHEDNQYQEYQETFFAMIDMDKSLGKAWSTTPPSELQKLNIVCLKDLFPRGNEIEM